jgi:hypothetical protein
MEWSRAIAITSIHVCTIVTEKLCYLIMPSRRVGVLANAATSGVTK